MNYAMTPKKFWAFIGMSALIFALALGAVGCGGSSGGDVRIDQQGGGTLSLSGHYILIGSLNPESELTPYISEIITDRLTVSQIENISEPLNINFSSRDIIFIADARNLSADNPTINAFVYNALSLSGATIAAVYPNADDVNNLENMLGIHFASPNDEPVDKHYEFIAVGKRYISSDADYLVYKEGDIPYNFVYVERSSKNESYFDANIESFDVYNPNPTYSDDAGIVDSDDYLPNNTNTNNTEDEEAEREINREQEAKAALARRVNELIRWSEGLNALAGEVAGEIIRTASAFAANVAAETKQAPDEILKLMSGVHTALSDDFDESFFDYDLDRTVPTSLDRKRQVAGGEWQRFKAKCGLNRSGYDQQWKNFRVSRRTSGKHMTYSFHSFQNNSDYYLINSSVTTQPQNLQVRSAYGPNITGGELHCPSATSGLVVMLGYHYAAVVGCTRGFTFQIWPGNNKGVQNLKIIPSLTVNKQRSYSDTDSWNIGGGVSFGGGGMGGAAPAGFGNVDASFNWGVSHVSAKQWTVSDYEIVPKAYYATGGIPVAQWNVNVEPPYYKAREGWTDFSTAARESVTLEAESIWQVVSPDVAYTFDFTTRTDWKNMFMWARDFNFLGAWRYDCTVEHIGKEGKLTFARPPHAALSDVVTHGTNEGKMYTAKIYTGDSWEAESDSYWLELMETSGEASMGGNFTYTVAPNYTGEPRRGRIMITTGRDIINLVFDQSPYPAEAKP